MKRTTTLFLTFVLLSFLGVQVFGQTTIAAWNFDDGGKQGLGLPYTADDGDANNIDFSGITVMNASHTGYTSGNVGDAFSGNDFHEADLTDKYYFVGINTSGYTNITLSYKMRGSNTGPRHFNVEYSTDGTTWNSFAGNQITIANNWTTGVVTDLALPEACKNKTTLLIRWIADSNNISVNNGTVANTGTNRIDDIEFKGEALGTDAFITDFELAGVNGAINNSDFVVLVDVPFGTDISALTPTITVSDGAVVSPAVAEADFNNPVFYNVISEDGNTTNTYEVMVTILENDATEIESFTFEQEGMPLIQLAPAIIDHGLSTIVVEVINGTDPNGLIPTIEISEGASIAPNSGVAQDFSAPFDYYVLAQNGVDDATYTVTVNVAAAANTENDIISFEIENQTNIDITGTDITVNVPYGTEITSLEPTIVVSPGASVSEIGAQDFTSGFTYTIVAQDGTTQTYDVTIVFDDNTAADIEDFVVVGQVGDAVISIEEPWTVEVHVDAATDIANLNPTITYSYGSSVTPIGVTDFSAPVEIEVTAEDGVTVKTWTITVLNLNGGADIIDFTTAGQVGNAVISIEEPWTVEVHVDATTDISNLNPTIELSLGATISPMAITDFSAPVEFTVVSEDLTETKIWTVTVLNLNDGADITDFTVAGQVGNAVINNSENTVEVHVNAATDISNLNPTIEISEGAMISPTGVTDYTEAVEFTVVSEDLTETKVWTVTVLNLNDGADITDFTVAGQIETAIIDDVNHTVVVNVVTGTDIENLNPTIEISEGASISPTNVTDFSSAVTYTVISEDLTVTNVWTVFVNVLNNEADILDFTVDGQYGDAIISTVDQTVEVHVLASADVSNLDPTIEISEGATISPVGITDFTTPVEYLVVAEDGIVSKTWTVTVVSLSNAAEIETFTIDTNEGTINSDEATVSLEMPNGTDLSDLNPTITISEGAQISPVWTDFTEAREYIVTAEDGTIKVWTVTITEAAPTTYDVTFSVVNGNGTLIAEVDATEITSPAEVEEGKTVVFNATPDTDYVVVAWTINGEIVMDGADNLTDLTLSVENLDENLEVTVEFDFVDNIANQTLSNFTVYPNPNNGQFVLDFANIEGRLNYQIVDVNGRVILSDEFVNYGINTKDISINIAPGMYFIKVTKGQKSIIERITIQ